MNDAIEDQLKRLLNKHFIEEGVYDLVTTEDDVDEVLEILNDNYEINKKETSGEGYLRVVLGKCKSMFGISGTVRFYLEMNNHRYLSDNFQIEMIDKTSEGEVSLNLTHLFKLSKTETETLLQQKQLLELYLFVNSNGLILPIGHCNIPWRSSLIGNTPSLELSLSSYRSSIPVCLIDVQLEYVPAAGKLLTTEAKLSEQLSLEREGERQRSLTVINYTKKWIGNLSPDRHIITTVEVVGSCDIICVTNFIQPIESAAKLLNTPMHAARFISLLGDSRLSHSSNCEPSPNMEVWHPPGSLLAAGSALPAEKATLLCSLLLGFKLDAYVGTGVDMLGAKVFVVLIKEGDTDGVSVWHPETGKKFPWKDKSVLNHIKEIHSVFNDNNLFVNLQSICNIHDVCYRFNENHLWKSFDPTVAKSGMQGRIFFPNLRPPSGNNETKLSQGIEQSLVLKCTEYRDGLALGGTVTCKGQIADAMSQSLWLCELQAITLKELDPHKLFESSCMAAVPSKCTLRAIPINHNHSQPDCIFSSIISSPDIRSLLETSNSNTCITIKSKVTIYPEDVTSTWTIVAVFYNNIE